jgi:hypothetical protein
LINSRGATPNDNLVITCRVRANPYGYMALTLTFTNAILKLKIFVGLEASVLWNFFVLKEYYYLKIIMD